MFRNYLAAAVRNLARNKLYAGVTILGLAVGFAAALLIGLYVRDELTFDRFVPGHGQVYLVTETLGIPGSKPIETHSTPMMLARPLKQFFPEVEASTRLSGSYFPPTVRRGEIVASEERIYWADPNFFQVIPLPVLAGDLSRALEAPDGIVMTRAMARKYFGKDAPIGETLQIEGQAMRVTAVLKDLPSNTHLTADMIGSARAPVGPIVQYEQINNALSNTLATYVRLKPGASPATMTPRFDTFLRERMPIVGLGADYGPFQRALHLVPLTQIHLTPSTQGALKPAVDPAVLLAIAAVGVLIVGVAAINFVTLMTARASRRAVEVGVRKALGAGRRDLVVQFLGEAFLYVAAAGLLALSLAELLIRPVSALLQRKLVLDYLHDPALGVTVAGVLLVTGLLAGAYPAAVLSSFRPSQVLKGGPVQAGGSGAVRQVLVVGQFAVLVALVLVAITIARQTLFALNDGLGVDKNQVIAVFARPCIEPLRDELRRQPGVVKVACASYQSLNMGNTRDAIPIGGRKVDISNAPVDFGFFEVFRVKPIAGRLFDPARPADGALDNPDVYPPVILNETAVRKLGFASPQAAIGKRLMWHGNWDETMRKPTFTMSPMRPSEIIGVVPDFTLGSVREPILPTLYSIGRNAPPNSIAMIARIEPGRTQETFATLDGLWDRLGGGRPLLRVTFDFLLLRYYLDTLIQGATVAIASAIALVIAALGLFALSAFTTERRTKEIGIRKALGASSADILKLLLWQFAKPVLIANVIAWPVAWFTLNWWLSSFAYHVDVAPWTFAAAGVGALVIALATVFVHALRVARAKPVGALRYE